MEEYWGEDSSVLFSAQLALIFERNTINFHPRSLMLLNYWTIHSNLEQKILLTVFSLQKIHILLQQLDELDKPNQYHAFCRTFQHNLGQMYMKLLFNFLPRLLYLYLDHSITNHKVTHCQGHQLVFKFFWFAKLIEGQVTILHAYIKFYHQRLPQLVNS